MRYLNKWKIELRLKLKRTHLELLTPEKMKLLGDTKITTDENGENEPHLEITEVLLIY